MPFHRLVPERRGYESRNGRARTYLTCPGLRHNHRSDAARQRDRPRLAAGPMASGPVDHLAAVVAVCRAAVGPRKPRRLHARANPPPHAFRPADQPGRSASVVAVRPGRRGVPDRLGIRPAGAVSRRGIAAGLAVDGRHVDALGRASRARRPGRRVHQSRPRPSRRRRSGRHAPARAARRRQQCRGAFRDPGAVAVDEGSRRNAPASGRPGAASPVRVAGAQPREQPGARARDEPEAPDPSLSRSRWTSAEDVRPRGAVQRAPAGPATQPSVDWTETAHRFHYFDYAHFARECREFTGSSPTEFLRACGPDGDTVVVD